MMATTICLANGMLIESLSKVLGWSNIKNTQLYAKITDEKLNDDLAILKNKNRLAAECLSFILSEYGA